MYNIRLSEFGWEKDQNFNEVFKSTFERKDFILGKSVKEFESNFASYCNSSTCITTANCTDALRLCLESLGTTRSSNVITVGFTWLSTYEVIANLGAKIKLADIKENLTIDLDQVESLIDENTTAIIGVDLFGEPINWRSKKFSVPTISDSAQSTGARYNNEIVGSIADFTCFSFYPTKNLSCLGDGGAIVTDHKDHAERIRMIANHGQKSKFNVEYIGYNSRLDSIQADILNSKLPLLDNWNKRRRQIASYYNQELKNYFALVPSDLLAYNVVHQYILMSDNTLELQQHLTEHKIESRRYYGNLAYKQPAYNLQIHLPNTEKASKSNLAIPVHQYLTDNEVEYVINTVKGFFK